MAPCNRTHSSEHSSEIRPYSCSQCPKRFANNSYLRQHFRIHTGARPIGPCPFCARMFRQQSHLQQHLRTHTGAKPYKCGQCEKMFSQLSNLQTHQRVHQGQDRPFRCQSCSKCFEVEEDLLNHIPAHFSTKHRKIHICTLCGKSYANPVSLERHLLKHTEDPVKRESSELSDQYLSSQQLFNDITGFQFCYPTPPATADRERPHNSGSVTAAPALPSMLYPVPTPTGWHVGANWPPLATVGNRMSDGVPTNSDQRSNATATVTVTPISTQRSRDILGFVPRGHWPQRHWSGPTNNRSHESMQSEGDTGLPSVIQRPATADPATEMDVYLT